MGQRSIRFKRDFLIFSSATWNGSKVPQSVNLTADPLCGLHVRPVFPLRGGIGFYANAAYSALRAHAAQNTNSHFGL
jgi:hypothetical protein